MLQPKRDGEGYVWTGLVLKQSKQNEAGKGVFATRALRVGTMIPMLGKAVPEADGLTHGWEYYGSKGAIDGHPRYLPYKGVGSHGLSLSMMLNEPVTDKPNCKFKLDHVVVALPIKKGEELTIDYGNAYETIRKKAGYTMKNNKHRHAKYPEYDSLKYPTAKVRNGNIQEWNAKIGKPVVKSKKNKKTNKIKKTGMRATRKELEELGLKPKELGPTLTPTEFYALLKKKYGSTRVDEVVKPEDRSKYGRKPAARK